MDGKRVARYGEWPSPVTASMAAAASVRLGGVAIDGGGLWWLEGRPAEQGRNVLVRWSPGGGPEDVTPPPFNVRTTVHEYGGGAFLVAGGEVWFANFADQRVYHHRPGTTPRPLTPAGPHRYADFILDAARDRLISVREDHSGPGEPVNGLAAIDRRTGEVTALARGHDFYSNPTLSPDGGRLAWLAWDHPHMPWDESEAWVAEIRSDGSLAEPGRAAGGGGISVFQPCWSPDGVLHVAADPKGWWNLYRWRGGRLECVLETEAEFGRPQWVFGLRTYGFDARGRIVAASCRRGEWSLSRIDPATGLATPLPLPYNEIDALAVSGNRALLVAGSPALPPAVVSVNLESGGKEVLREAFSAGIDAGFISAPEPTAFPATDGHTAHALFYPPRNPGFQGPDDELPPLIVTTHGGPTSSASATLNPRIQYWTSRGIAVLDVDYRGSTGYGRAYRDLLKDKWGVYDVDDCVRGARFLVVVGRVDGRRIAIRGGSAGGFTTLAALAFRDFFRAGASYYGVGDLEALARDTHKFESRYLDSLIGPYPQRRDLYVERSPVHSAGRLSAPVIFFQGLEDRIVPPDQAESMVEALRARGIPVAYLAFEGEQHGFRKAETIRRTLEAELYFYSRVFGFTPADGLEPVEIENL